MTMSAFALAIGRLALTALLGGVILGACLGYGRLMAWRAGTGIALAVGFCVILLLGGVLNLLGVVSRGAILVVLGVGLVATCSRRVRGMLTDTLETIRGAWRQWPIITAVCASALALIAAADLFTPEFNRIDDYPAYLVFPAKMLGTGSLGVEPFSERRLQTGLAGLYFPHAVVLALLDYHALHLIDPVIGSVIAWVILIDLARRLALPSLCVPLAPLGCGLLVPLAGNLTATTMAGALAFALVVTLRGAEADRHKAAIALLGFGLIAVKSTGLPLAVCLLAALYASRLRTPTVPALVAGGIALALAPVMASQYLDTGTPLFPLLGQGGYGGQYGDYHRFGDGLAWSDIVSLWWSRTVIRGPVLALAAATVIGAIMTGWAAATRTMALVLLGVLAANLALCFGTGGEAVRRYVYAADVLCLAVTLSFGLVAVGLGPNRRPRALPIAVIGLVVGATLFTHHNLIDRFVRLGARNLGTLVLGPAIRPDMLYGRLADGSAERAILTLQQSVPAGTPILQRLDYPFLFDFRRNPIMVMDWPGGASPPPGMPLFRGEERLAAYLLSQNVRFVAYAYANEALFPESGRDGLLRTRWIDASVRAAFDTQANLRALMRTRRVIFDDGTRAMIDLAQRRAE